MKTTTELFKMDESVGKALDSAARDPERARFLLRARRAIRAELESRHTELERQDEIERQSGRSDGR